MLDWHALEFCSSPLYTIHDIVEGSSLLLDDAEAHNKIELKLNADQWSLLRDPKYRLYLYCGVVPSLIPKDGLLLEFPRPIRITVNGSQVSGVFQGLKHRKGTAKPVDLTSYISKPGISNVVELKTGSIDAKYVFKCYITEVFTEEELLAKMRQQPVIAVQDTLNLIHTLLNGEKDGVLTTTSQTVQLRCPISFGKLNIPARSKSCQHLQCFDLISFIQSQMQIPAWQCPICQKCIKYDDVRVCQYTKGIVDSIVLDTEKIKINSDGSWVLLMQNECNSSPNTEAVEVVPEPEINKSFDDISYVANEALNSVNSNLTLDPNAKMNDEIPLASFETIPNILARTPLRNKSRDNSMMLEDTLKHSPIRLDFTTETLSDTHGDKNLKQNPVIDLTHKVRLPRQHPSYSLTEFLHHDDKTQARDSYIPPLPPLPDL